VSINPETKQTYFEVSPIMNDSMPEIPDTTLDTITDIMKGMCAVASLEPPSLDALLEIYYDQFEDMEKRREGKDMEDVIIPFPVKPVTKH
jgi:hypothetical protein